jgi:deoxyribonuclease V
MVCMPLDSVRNVSGGRIRPITGRTLRSRLTEPSAATRVLATRHPHAPPVGDRTQRSWPSTATALRAAQRTVRATAAAALAQDPWRPVGDPAYGGCFVTFASGTPGDRAWAAAVVWRAGAVIARSEISERTPAAYQPGLLAIQAAPILDAAVAALPIRPDVLLVDAAGLDHPERAGLALHLGAARAIPSVGVTRRPLLATGRMPAERLRGARSPLYINGECVAYWVCTRDGTRPLVAHGGWRTTPEAAVDTILTASTPSARTPAPLREARRLAREARARTSTRMT